MLYIPSNMHGTHERSGVIRPAGLTKFAITNTDYRAFDIYNADDFIQEIKDSGFNRGELWYQIKESRTDFYNSYSNEFSIDETFNLNLAVLNTNYIDSYAIYLGRTPHYSSVALKKWEQLEELYREGKLNYIGLEHLEDMHHLQEIYDHAKIKPTVLQLHSFSPEVLRYCLENGIIFQYFGIPGLIKAPHNDVITDIAQAHSVSVKQVFMKLVIELGMHPLTGCNSKKYLSENADLNFALSANETIRLIKSGVFGNSTFNEYLVDSFPLMSHHNHNILEKNTEQMLSIYEDLQNGTLVKLNDIVAKLLNCSTEQLTSEFKKLTHYIPKLDPTSLANIITNQSPVIIDYLKQYGADFSEITSNSYAKIINAYGVDHLPILQEKLDVPAEKLLLASLNAEDINYFNQLFITADLNKINRHDIVAIVKTFPETLTEFISANIAPEVLLMAATAINDKATFDELLVKCDVNKLYGIEITEIILQFGPQVIKQLNSYHFYRLTITDLDKITNSLGIDAIKELTNYDVSSSILLPALKLGGAELFNEVARKVDINKLKAVKYIKQIIKLGGEGIIDTLIEHDVPAGLLLSVVIQEETDVSLLKKLIAKVDLSKIDFYSIYFCIEHLIEENNNEKFQILTKSNIDFSKIELSYRLIDAVIRSNKPEWLQELVKAGIDPTKLDEYGKTSIINYIIDINQFEWFQELAKANIDLTTFEESGKATIINHIIDINRPEIFQKLAEVGIDLAKLDSSSTAISKIINHIIDINKPEWLQKLNKSGIDLTNLESPHGKFKIIAKIIDNNIPQWFQTFSESSIDLTNIEGYYKACIVNHIINITKPEWLEELAKAKIDLSAIEPYNQIEIINKIIDSVKFEWVQTLYHSGIDLTKLKGSYQKEVIVRTINTNKPELLQKLVEDKIIDLTKLNPYLVVKVAHNALNTKQFEWIQVLTDNKLDLSKAEMQDQLFIEQLKECHSDVKCYSECFTQEADITQYNSDCVGKFAFSDNEL